MNTDLLVLQYTEQDVLDLYWADRLFERILAYVEVNDEGEAIDVDRQHVVWELTDRGRLSFQSIMLAAARGAERQVDHPPIYVERVRDIDAYLAPSHGSWHRPPTVRVPLSPFVPSPDRHDDSYLVIATSLEDDTDPEYIRDRCTWDSAFAMERVMADAP